MYLIAKHVNSIENQTLEEFFSIFFSFPVYAILNIFITGFVRKT